MPATGWESPTPKEVARIVKRLVLLVLLLPTALLYAGGCSKRPVPSPSTAPASEAPLAAASPAASVSGEVPAATYRNPVGGDDLVTGDPFVLLYEGVYYLYGRSTAEGFLCWTSPNLADWKSIGVVHRRTETTWAGAAASMALSPLRVSTIRQPRASSGSSSRATSPRRTILST